MVFELEVWKFWLHGKSHALFVFSIACAVLQDASIYCYTRVADDQIYS